MLRLKVGNEMDRDDVLRRLVEIQYTRNDLSFTRGTFRVRGGALDVFPVYEEHAVRVEFFGDEIERVDRRSHPAHRRGPGRNGHEVWTSTRPTHCVAGPARDWSKCDRRRSRPSSSSTVGGPSRSRGKLARGRSDLRHAHRRTTSRCCARPASACVASRTTRRHLGRTRQPWQQPPTVCSTTCPEDLPARRRRVPRRRCRRYGGMYAGRHAPASSVPGRPRPPACPPAYLHNRPLDSPRSSSDRIGQAHLPSPRPPGPDEIMQRRRHRQRRTSRSSRPTGLLDPEVVRDARPRARSTT